MSLAKYTFLPWLKQGIANKIIEQDNLGANIPASSTMAIERPELTVKLNLNTHEVRKNIKLHGPGDITGINNDAILRAHPIAGTQDFESNMLAYIEFYEEDFPWRYTPAIRAEGEKRLRPWLFLIVAKEEECEFHSDGNGLPYVTINSGFADKVFSSPRETWAWAHVHINHTISSVNTPQKVGTALDEDPDVAYSRLICPRRLERAEEGVKYHAFLIPTFETGRLAGLGEDPKDVFAQQSSWTVGGTADSSIRPNDYPVYYNWEFKTGRFGDFETLVKILKAQPLGPGFGKREMNIKEPGMGLNGSANSRTLGLEGALKPPSFQKDKWPDGLGDIAFRNKLESILNISQDIQDEATAVNVMNPYHDSANPFYSNTVVEDPVVTPPIYGKWHAMVKRVSETGNTKEWVDELNLDPRNRVAASIGAQTVRKQQEKFMEMAWQQVGEINDANQRIREAELAKMVNKAIYEKHYRKLKNDNKLLMVTAAAQKSILNPGTNQTFEENLTASKIPNAARSAAFKKVIRPGKKNIRKMNLKGEDDETVVLIPIQQSLMTNFNLYDPNDDDKALTTAKTKIKPSMTISTGEVEIAMNVFLDLQENQAQENEDLQLDHETVAAQEQFVTDFNTFATTLAGLPTSAQLNPVEDLDSFTLTLFEQMDPLVTITNLVTPLIMSGNTSIEEVKPIMAYPGIPEPMFLYLQNLSQDFIIPNIREIPENTITLLENNQVFIEAFMAGMNHEMSKELLWREYPTDQRGSYFRNFWDDKDSLSSTDDEENAHDIMQMDQWEDHLGQHNQRINSESGDDERKKNFVVLVIRGDVLRKYPNTVVYAQKAISTGPNSPRTLSDSSNLDNIRTPIFQADLEPDIALFGFNLTKDDVIGDSGSAGWFFVLKERPGQINFGLDDSETIPQEEAHYWAEMEWGHLVDSNESLDGLYHIHCVYDDARCTSNSPSWGTNSAEMAFILYQDPVIFARHGEEMLP